MKINPKKLLLASLAVAVFVCSLASCARGGAAEDTATPALSAEEKDERLKTRTDEVILSVLDGDPCVAYVTYNGYHNPVAERIYDAYEPDRVYTRDYEYNDDGLLVSVTAKDVEYGNYGDSRSDYTVKYILDGETYTGSEVYTGDRKSPDRSMHSTVEYYENGTISRWSMGYKSDSNGMGFSQDESGRRTAYEEWEEKLSYTYGRNGRRPTSATYVDGDLTVQYAFSYQGGRLAGVTLDSTEKGRAEIALAHTSDGKRLLRSVFRTYCAETEYEEGVFELSYVGERVGSIGYAYYENGVLHGKYLFAFDYDSTGTMIRQTDTRYLAEVFEPDVYELSYDSLGNRTGIAITHYDTSGAVEGRTVKEMAYNEAKLVTEKSTKRHAPDGTVLEHEAAAYAYNEKNAREWEAYWSYAADGTVLEHEERFYEYDSRGSFSRIDSYRYDSSGNILERMDSTESREYHENGKLKTYTQLTVQYLGGRIEDKYGIVTEYDERGALIKETVTYYGNPDNRDEITDTEIFYG